MTGKVIILPPVEAPKTRKTWEDFGMVGSPATRIVPPRKGKGSRYNRAKAKAQTRKEW